MNALHTEPLNRFSVQLSMDNDAFTGGAEEAPARDLNAALEVARILRKIADTVEREGFSGFFETILDANGNDVGRFAAKPESYYR